MKLSQIPRIRLAASCLLILLAGCISKYQEKEDQGENALIVMITADQLSFQLLEKYQKYFEHGFKRLNAHSVKYNNATINHATTHSLPGHTTISTGVNPNKHGINGNSWIKPEFGGTGRIAGVVPHLDRENRTLGSDKNYSFSGASIRVYTLADRILEHDVDSIAASISVTPLAVLYAATNSNNKNRNHVYWMDTDSHFGTSEVYLDSYPSWVENFNAQIKQPECWTPTNKTMEVAKEVFGQKTEQFAHCAPTSDLAATLRWNSKYHPSQNTHLINFTKAIISNANLGQDHSTDLLNLAIKLTDSVGHKYGPSSLEQLDVLIRLDKELGILFNYLDKKVGHSRYLVAFTSDHGAPEISSSQLRTEDWGKKVTSEDIQSLLDDISIALESKDSSESHEDVIYAKLKASNMVSNLYHPNFKSSNTEYQKLVANSYINDQISTYPLWTKNNVYGQNISANHPSNYGFMVELPYQSNMWSANSTHGSHYLYDRHVPLMFMSSQFKAANINQAVHTVDIVPSLLEVIAINDVSDLDGDSLNLKKSVSDSD